MDAKLIFWTGAWLNMLAIVLLTVSGVRRIRRGAVAEHRRRMLVAAWLVLAFLGSYGLKLAFLGREALETWAPAYVAVLRVHELCIAVMVLAGSTAIYLAWQLGLARARDGSQGAYAPDQVPARRALHRRAGRTAIYAAFLGLVTAGVVLLGMYGRSV